MYGQAIKLVEAARELLKSHGYFVDNLWHVDDVHFICEEKGFMYLSDEEAMEVFSLACEHIDGDMGISWPQLEKAVESYVKRKMMIIEFGAAKMNPLAEKKAIEQVQS